MDFSVNNIYTIKKPKRNKVPFILSIPHSGINFPEEIKSSYNENLTKQPDDTDWFLQDLYDFASEIGVTTIYANYSRWVIDLNRDPQSKALYNDGRIITSLTPKTDFLGNNIYKKDEYIPSKQEIDRRLEKYYWPYYKKIEEIISEFKKDYKNVLFWDAHSIRSYVPTIRKEPFPELILGNNDKTTSNNNLIETAISNLKEHNYTVSHNTPFKGGYLTRYFGKPKNNIHALQLEMSKSIYMEKDELTYDNLKSKEVKNVLKTTFEALIKTLEQLNS